MEIERLYFYTATILNWQKLLIRNDFKDLITSSLQNLVEREKIKIYGFVIMPNHIHLLWEMLEMNGKELPYISFMKFTGHQFLKKLRSDHPKVLPYFKVNTSTRMYHFWERNAMPIEVYSRKVIEQKLNYIHNNPLQENGVWRRSLQIISIPQLVFMKREKINLIWLPIIWIEFYKTLKVLSSYMSVWTLTPAEKGLQIIFIPRQVL